MKLSAGAATVKLAANDRKMIAVLALAGTEPVSTLAVRHGVSRPLVYWQMHKASTALDELFSPAQTDDVDKVVFSQPVTRRWLEQATLGLAMIAHASMRGVVEFMHDVLGVSISPGSVHNILQQAAQRAVGINDSDDLSPIRVGLHDELFQGSQPVLTGIDAASTDCYLLAAEDHRDGDTWAIHLLDLQAQGLKPDYTLADAGTGLRAGQKLAWPDTPCHGDVFHICQQFETLVNIWARIASRVRPEREALEVRLANPSRRCRDSLLTARLAELRSLDARAHQLAEDLRTLAGWLERDVLALAGSDLATRHALFDFVVDELHQREPEDPSRIGTMRVAPQNQRDDLLAFVGVLGDKLAAIARTAAVPDYLVRETCLLRRKPDTSGAFWQGWNRLHAAMGRKFFRVWTAVSRAMESTPRSSSLVENLNLRRSRCGKQLGKSPREAMTGEDHPHWLTLLGLGPLQPRQS
jgi:hypothetical protein